jgi:hypothetical protein
MLKMNGRSDDNIVDQSKIVGLLDIGTALEDPVAKFYREHLAEPILEGNQDVLGPSLALRGSGGIAIKKETPFIGKQTLELKIQQRNKPDIGFLRGFSLSLDFDSGVADFGRKPEPESPSLSSDQSEPIPHSIGIEGVAGRERNIRRKFLLEKKKFFPNTSRRIKAERSPQDGDGVPGMEMVSQPKTDERSGVCFEVIGQRKLSSRITGNADLVASAEKPPRFHIEEPLCFRARNKNQNKCDDYKRIDASRFSHG